ncbi:hypothetical protein FGO68_gene13383 [Halteria grandinella]|uniref:Uncharacterized protein n=1 Tax=Halteria grandinella TaxID=5974 RepID=A0A8J8SYH7_HALGN|nr:hypothetical protein FGO68_gene13383 [Halteria grandinella]
MRATLIGGFQTIFSIWISPTCCSSQSLLNILDMKALSKSLSSLLPKLFLKSTSPQSPSKQFATYSISSSLVM